MRHVYAVLWSNPLWGLYHGPRPLRALAAWALPRWYGASMTDEEKEAARLSWCVCGEINMRHCPVHGGGNPE